MDWENPYVSRRVPLLAANCVATTQPLAAQAGLAMLARGGNAVDAAVATAIALTVVEPVMNGIGGDAFAMVWDGEQLTGLNASGRASSGCQPSQFAGAAMPQEGWDAVTVPGAPSGWKALHARYGRLPFADLFEPGIRYATDGFAVPPVIARIWARQAERLRDQPGFAAAFLPHGRAPLPGEWFSFPDQGRTLQAIAESGTDDFYCGILAEAIGRASATAGGRLTTADMAAHRCEWVTPIDAGFAGYRVHELPPNGQGIAALIALGVLERCAPRGLPVEDVEMQHLQIEAMKCGLADVRAHVADPDHMTVTVEDLLDPGRLDALARSIDRSRAAAPAPMQNAKSSTVYLAAADASGMMVSLIQSNYNGFGSGVVVPGTGIALNNRGACFVTDPAHPNCVAPGKRPLHTIIPGFLTRDGEPVAAFGVMGGSMQPQGHLQVLARMLLAGQNPQAAIDAPRWRVEPGEVWVEERMPAPVRQGLQACGHHLKTGTALDFGAAQIIWRRERGYVAGSETRRDGCAVGF